MYMIGCHGDQVLVHCRHGHCCGPLVSITRGFGSVLLTLVSMVTKRRDYNKREKTKAHCAPFC